MPRQARLDVPGALHHIIVRGIDRGKIFKDDKDKEKFIERLGEKIVEGKCSVYAWVLMDNHIHILFKSGKKGISEVMRRLLTWYAIYFNHRHRRTGHLFENRYKSILCEEDRYLMALARYLHLNPVRAGIIKTIEELDRYPWSGHSAIIGKRKHKWMDTEYILYQFADKRKTSRRKYREFIEEGIGLGHMAELTGGGLIRSLGGWSQVISSRRKRIKEESDERILGSGDFVNEILKETEEREIRQLKLRQSGKTVKGMIEEECAKEKVSTIELKSGSRRSRVSNLRAKIAWRSMNELGLSMAEIARHLGVNTSSVTRVIAKLEKKGMVSYAP